MKMKLIQRMVRQEIRRTLNPTGLLGKRGPAKNIPVMVRRQMESGQKCYYCFGLAIGGSQ